MEALNLYFSILYILTAAAAIYLWSKRSKISTSQINIDDLSFSKVYTLLLPALVILAGAIIRLYDHASVPAGLHQDEASIGYEAYILAFFGLDRDLNPFPVYPITYGSGGGSPLMIYLNVITTLLFGSGPKTLRLLPAILGILTLITFYFAIRVLSADSLKRSEGLFSVTYVNGEYIWIPLVSLAILAFSPWHIMLSRWSLDSNTTPFFVSLALLLFSLGAYFQKESVFFDSIGSLFSGMDKKKRLSLKSANPRATVFFSLSAICYALCLYSYGSTTIIIPIHLIAISVFCLKTGRMNFSQLLLGIFFFVLVSLPLILFYAVNFLGLPEIVTPYFSITAFTAHRSVFSGEGNFILRIFNNFMVMLKNITFGNSGEQILNYIPGFAPLFSFTFPMTILGFICSIKRIRDGEILDVFITSIFAPSFIFGLFVEEDINRMVMLFLPLIYYMARGFIFSVSEIVILEKDSQKKSGKVAYLICKGFAPALFIVGSIFFVNTYFTDYNHMSEEAFMPGYGDACAYADSCAGVESTVYSTYEHVSAPFMVALFYTRTSPEVFAATVHYKDPDAEFRIADSFGHFVFELPKDLQSALSSSDNPDDIYILHNTEVSSYDTTGYETVTYGNFSVLVPENLAK